MFIGESFVGETWLEDALISLEQTVALNILTMKVNGCSTNFDLLVLKTAYRAYQADMLAKKNQGVTIDADLISVKTVDKTYEADLLNKKGLDATIEADIITKKAAIDAPLTVDVLIKKLDIPLNYSGKILTKIEINKYFEMGLKSVFCRWSLFSMGISIVKAYVKPKRLPRRPYGKPVHLQGMVDPNYQKVTRTTQRINRAIDIDFIESHKQHR